jgi:serine/threonine protein kinase
MIGHYRIVELLGSGAMGTVHVAVDTFIERAVAIKSLRPELTRDPDFVSRFRAEATSLARLNHPNITTLYSPILEGSDLYMVMELVRGRPLDDVLRERGKPVGVKESLAIIAQAADGLSYAHQMGVIHRDIKPANLMIGNDGRVKIMDFGIARVQGSVRLTRAGTAVGTPLYMSPEQCRGKEGDERSDLYSLAIVLYELLSGAPPFTGTTEYDLIQAQINTNPPPLVPRAVGVTPELESAIMTALAKQPEQRFPSVRAFSDAIGATALRLDATSVVRNATHLVESSQEAAVPQKASTRGFALVRSRAAMFARRFKGLPLATKGMIAAAAIAALLSSFYFGFGHSNAPSILDAGRADQGQEHGTPANSVAASTPSARQSQPNGNSGEGSAQEPQIDKKEGAAMGDRNAALASAQKQVTNQSPEAAAASPGTPAAINELRIAIKGNANERIKAADFSNVTNDSRVKLLALAKTLAATGDKEAQFALGMLLLEAPDHPDIEAAYKALNDARFIKACP